MLIAEEGTARLVHCVALFDNAIQGHNRYFERFVKILLFVEGFQADEKSRNYIL